MDRFYVISNSMKDPEGKIAKEIKAYLNFRGKQCIIQERQGKESLRSYKYTNANLIPDDTECILVVGGDGTLLQAARDMIERNIPLLGVNKGTLGYLAEVDGDNMEEALDRLIDDNVVIEDRMMLEGCAYSHKKKLLQDFALNDIVIARSGRLQIIDFNIYVNGEFLRSYSADGIIISTPTGSTGYSLSAGGPIVSPEASLILLTPIAPHSLNTRSIVLPADAEITVEENTKGFFVELWASAPELYAVTIISPSGEQIPRILVRRGASEQFHFIFEGTTITVDYRIDTKETASQLIFFRFIRPTPGLWTIRIFPQLTVTGNYHLWLPLRELTDGNNFFLRSNPEITLTSPSAARQVITVGGYQASNTSIYADSGRGYTITGEIKPDFVAPAVDVYGPGLLGNFITFTGTSAAAAITAGACAQIMQWAIVDQNNTVMSNTSIKNMLIRGTAKPENRTYPNREWGYGTLDVFGAFQNLRL